MLIYTEGDQVAIFRAVGEALWLNPFSKEREDEQRRDFKPLPAALRLHEVKGIKKMHDASEGGGVPP